jgi:hypothetical protein
MPRPFVPDEPSGVGLGSDVDHAHSPTEPEVPLLPPASMAETEAFLNDIMPPECVLESPFLDFAYLLFPSDCPNP